MVRTFVQEQWSTLTILTIWLNCLKSEQTVNAFLDQNKIHIQSIRYYHGDMVTKNAIVMFVFCIPFKPFIKHISIVIFNKTPISLWILGDFVRNDTQQIVYIDAHFM